MFRALCRPKEGLCSNTVSSGEDARSAIENFKPMEGERIRNLEAFYRRLKFEEIQVTASLLDPATKNLRCIQPYLFI